MSWSSFQSSALGKALQLVSHEGARCPYGNSSAAGLLFPLSPSPLAAPLTHSPSPVPLAPAGFARVVQVDVAARPGGEVGVVRVQDRGVPHPRGQQGAQPRHRVRPRPLSSPQPSAHSSPIPLPHALPSLFSAFPLYKLKHASQTSTRSDLPVRLSLVSDNRPKSASGAWGRVNEQAIAVASGVAPEGSPRPSTQDAAPEVQITLVFLVAWGGGGRIQTPLMTDTCTVSRLWSESGNVMLSRSDSLYPPFSFDCLSGGACHARGGGAFSRGAEASRRLPQYVLFESKIHMEASTCEDKWVAYVPNSSALLCPSDCAAPEVTKPRAPSPKRADPKP